MEKENYEKVVDAINANIKQEEQIVIDNMPKFQRGIAEASLAREMKIWKDIKAVFEKHKIMPSVGIKVKTDTQPSDDAMRPNLAFAGIVVDISYLVNPVDLEGRDGSMPENAIEEIANLRKEREQLQRKLEGGK